MFFAAIFSFAFMLIMLLIITKQYIGVSFVLSPISEISPVCKGYVSVKKTACCPAQSVSTSTRRCDVYDCVFVA